MEKIKIDIPEIKFENDFTIIYKGQDEEIIEIKTSRDEMMRKLRYFKKKINELKYVNEYYIHDEFHSNVFKEFIKSVQENSVELNEKNYLDFYKMSQKYEFFELKESIENFISNRPDLHLMISHLSDENNVQNQENIDEEKEKIISKNLDFCLEHGNLSKLSVSSLNRIFNHPEKVLHNHHLLYKFIKQRIEERVKEIKTSKTQNEDENNLFILINSLDYNEMSEDEIIEIIDFSEKNFELPFFYPNNSQKVIKSIIQSNKDKDDEIKNIKNELLLQKQNQEQQTQILNEFKTHLSKLEEKYEQIVQQNEQMKNALLDQQTKN